MSNFTEQPSFIVGDPILTNTDSRLDSIEQRLSIIEQLLTQQEQLQNNSFASNTPPGQPLTMSMLEGNNNSVVNRTNEETLPTQPSLSSVGGKNKTKSNKKKKSKNQTKRKRKV